MSQDLMKYMERPAAVIAAPGTVAVPIGRDYGADSARVTIARRPRSFVVTMSAGFAGDASTVLQMTGPEARAVAEALLSAAGDIEREAA